MDIELRDIEELTTDPTNARRHDARNIAAIRESLSRFGQRRPAVIRSDGTVLAGNGMLEAARALGWSEVAVTVVPDGWSSEEARAYALADNRTAELAEWDLTVLDEHLFDLSDAGFDIVALGFEDVNATPTDVDDAFSRVPDGERSDVTQMTFTMTLAQCDIVKAALALALDRGASAETGNANSNGNSLERICREWSDGR